MKVAHLTTADISLRYLLLPQLTAVNALDGVALGISASGDHVPTLEQAGIRHIELEHSTRSFDPLADLRAARELWRILRTERPDVLHTHTPKPGIYGRIVGRLAGTPVVVNTVHGLYATLDDGLVKRGLVYALEALAARFSDAELVQSREDYELLIRRRITIPSRTVHLGNGVDLRRFDGIRSEARERLRTELGVEKDDIVVGIVGRLVAEKGFRELIDASRQLGDRYVMLAIGPPEPEKRDALSAAEIAAAKDEGARFLGFRTDVRDWYEAMDIFALPSYREGFPRAAMEAAAMCLPVVASDIRGCREVVEPGGTGLLVPLRDARSLADAIRALGDDPELRLRMGVTARNKAEAEFDEERIVRTVLNTQVAALRRRGRFHQPAVGAVRIRPACPNDAASISAILLSHSVPAVLSGRLQAWRKARRLIASAQGAIFVAEDEVSPLGYAISRSRDVSGQGEVVVPNVYRTTRVETLLQEAIRLAT